LTEQRRTIVWFEDCASAGVLEVGGKGAGLGELVGAGLAVPPGFAVTTSAHSAFLAANGLAERERELLAGMDADDITSVNRVSEEMAALTEAAAIPEKVECDMRAAYAELSARTEVQRLPVAVRSSARAEDLAGASFAGQLRTFLWVVGVDEVLEHVRRCWAGFSSPEALTYRRRAGLDQETLMGVCVQQMVDARVAGVMFTLNPINGDRSKIAIESSWGLGEALVAGEVNPDRFIVDKVTLDILERAVGGKEVEYRFSEESGQVEQAAVEAERRTILSLEDDDIGRLARLGKEIERHHGRPMDIEWAVDGAGGLFALQSRPETVWSQREAAPVAAKRSSPLDYVLAELMAPGEAARAKKEGK
jgi:phosphoenolpyruvate synthase/pyruvate phosphate dikinase